MLYHLREMLYHLRKMLSRLRKVMLHAPQYQHLHPASRLAQLAIRQQTGGMGVPQA